MADAAAHVSTSAPNAELIAHGSRSPMAGTPAGVAEATAQASASAPKGRPPAPGDNPTSAAATVAPTPGLTVIHFHNSHLVYAITWYTLALMTAMAIPLGMRRQ
jgi:cytochrome oxidase assembly protein ShyY1